MLSPENSSTGRLRRHFTNAIRNVKGASASLERTEVKGVRYLTQVQNVRGCQKAQ